MGQEFKSGPDITGLIMRLDRVRTWFGHCWLASLPNTTYSFIMTNRQFFELFLFGHQLYTFESDVLNNFLSNIWWRKALRINHLRIDYSLWVWITPQIASYGVMYRRPQTLGSGLAKIPVPSLEGVIEITVPKLCKLFAPPVMIFLELLRVLGKPLILNQGKVDVCRVL